MSWWLSIYYYVDGTNKGDTNELKIDEQITLNNMVHLIFK
jgi:hypothetical protein